MENSSYKIVDGPINHGDNYIINGSHVKTFHGSDMECIEDRNNGAVKVEIVKS